MSLARIVVLSIRPVKQVQYLITGPDSSLVVVSASLFPSMDLLFPPHVLPCPAPPSPLLQVPGALLPVAAL